MVSAMLASASSVRNVPRIVLKENIGFLFVNIQASRTDLAGFDAGQQRLGVDQRTARRVDEHHALFHLLHAGGVYHVARFGRQRAVEGDDVAGAEQLDQRNVGKRRIVGGERVVAEHPHSEPAADADEAAPDFAGPHNADRFAVQIKAHHVVQAEVEIARADIGFVNAPD